MKIKYDFITNSSSASFILFIKSSEKNIDDFMKKWENFINFYVQDNLFRFHDHIVQYQKNAKKLYKYSKKLKKIIDKNEATDAEKNIYKAFYSNYQYDVNLTSQEIIKIKMGRMEYDHISKNLFSITSCVTMFNDFDDIPDWMKYLIILDNMKDQKLKDFGFKEVRLRIIQ